MPTLNIDSASISTLSADSVAISGSLFGTASWALNVPAATTAVTSSYPFDISGSTIYSNVYSNTGEKGGFSTDNSFFVGVAAGLSASNAFSSNFFSNGAGTFAINASEANFFGQLAGYSASNANQSNFIGGFSGQFATNANRSSFVGYTAGQSATLANNSVFVGHSAGINAASASYSVLIGNRAGRNPAGSIGRNNIVIGNNVTLPVGQQNGINIGGIIFGTGSYYSVATAFSGSANGRIGINQPNPIVNFDVSGSGRFTNSLQVTGSLIAPEITGSLFGTASWSSNTVSSSYPFSVTGSTVYSNTGDKSNINPVSSILIGKAAGNNTPFASKSVFIGEDAGGQAQNSDYSVYIGTTAGYNAYDAAYSNFIGAGAGNTADAAAFSNFIGNNAGNSATSASYSTLIGYNAGRASAGITIGSNNLVIGTNVTLENNRRDSINIGGILFGTGSHSTTSGNAFSGSVNGRIGINQPIPTVEFDVSGSGRFTNGLTVTGSVVVSDITGSLFGTASYSLTSSYLSGSVETASYSLTASYFSGSIDTASFAFTASYLSGSVETSSFAISSSVAVSSSYPIAVVGTTIYNGHTNDFSTTSSTLIGFSAGSGSGASTNGITAVGRNAGFSSSGSFNSNFFGLSAGSNSSGSRSSVMVGSSAGMFASGSSGSVFIGDFAGFRAAGSGDSIAIGRNAGKAWFILSTANTPAPMGNNNIIIGNTISLPEGKSNSINIAGILFGTGSYSPINPANFFEPVLTGSVGNGRIGINVVDPEATLEVSGSDLITFAVSGSSNLGSDPLVETTSINSMLNVYGIVSMSSDVSMNATLNVSGAISMSSDVTMLAKLVLEDVGINLNFTNDFDAEQAGVPLYGLYHDNGIVRIRMF